MTPQHSLARNSSAPVFTPVTSPSSTALTADLKRVAQQQSDLSDYAAQLTRQYQAQFTALNTLMARMNTNSQYLTRLFGGANSSGTLSNK